MTLRKLDYVLYLNARKWMRESEIDVDDSDVAELTKEQVIDITARDMPILIHGTIKPTAKAYRMLPSFTEAKVATKSASKSKTGKSASGGAKKGKPPAKSVLPQPIFETPMDGEQKSEHPPAVTPENAISNPFSSLPIEQTKSSLPIEQTKSSLLLEQSEAEIKANAKVHEENASGIRHIVFAIAPEANPFSKMPDIAKVTSRVPMDGTVFVIVASSIVAPQLAEYSNLVNIKHDVLANNPLLRAPVGETIDVISDPARIEKEVLWDTHAPNLTAIPKIRASTDPYVFWLNARPDDVLRVVLNAEDTLAECKYFHVIR